MLIDNFAYFLTIQLIFKIFGYEDSMIISELEWFPWEDASRDFLLVLYSPGNLILWNTITGHRIWSVTYPQTLVAVTLDPFDLRNAVC